MTCDMKHVRDTAANKGGVYSNLNDVRGTPSNHDGIQPFGTLRYLRAPPRHQTLERIASAISCRALLPATRAAQ